MITAASHITATAGAAVASVASRPLCLMVQPLYRLVHLTLSRFYSTSGVAQPQLDLDYYYHNGSSSSSSYCGDRIVAAAPVLDTQNSVSGRRVQWSFIGCPRAKKRVYAEALSKLLEVPYISMASLVRQDLNPRSYLYKQIAEAVNCGAIVPEDIIFGLLSKRLEDGCNRGETGFILDGIPRSQLQAEILDELVEIDLVVNFKSNDDYLMQDQQEDVWKDKFKAYFKQSKQLEDYYKKQKKLLDFQVQSAPGETWQGLLAALHLQHINAVDSPKKLTSASTLQ